VATGFWAGGGAPSPQRGRGQEAPEAEPQDEAHRPGDPTQLHGGAGGPGIGAWGAKGGGGVGSVGWEKCDRECTEHGEGFYPRDNHGRAAARIQRFRDWGRVKVAPVELQGGLALGLCRAGNDPTV